ncbi:hypothetical protein Chor_009539 [Crotalus horridus]
MLLHICLRLCKATAQKAREYLRGIQLDSPPLLSIQKEKTIPRSAKLWVSLPTSAFVFLASSSPVLSFKIECQSYGRGAHLASILTTAETLLVAEHISTYQWEFANVWIGLHDVRQTRKWRWADESTYNYKSWMNYQPDNYGNNEHCVELRRSTGFKQWNDIQCNAHNAYICKHVL